MTTNKPEVLIWDVADPELHGDVMVVRLEDYEALQAECEELKRALTESRANDLAAMGYLNQIRAIVGGDDFPDMVRRCASLRTAMIEAKSYIEHYMYGGSSYREPAAKAVALIDGAMQEVSHEN